MTHIQGAIVLRHLRRLVTAQSPSQQADGQLLDSFITDRDQAAFAAIVQRHGGMVLAVCKSVLRHQQDAEDVFQAAFLVLARKAHTIRKQQALSSWLHGVAYRLALKAKSQADRRQARERLAVAQASTGTLDDLTVRELRVILHEELNRLPEKYRTPLLLCYWEGKTRDEAAQRLGVTADAFKKCLERARNLLGSRLVGRGLAPSAAFLAALLSESGVEAAVSSVLAKSTAQAAAAFAVGKGASAGASAAAVVLAEGVIRTMNITKWATTILSMVLASVLCTGLGLATFQVLGGQQSDGSVNAAPAADDKRDQAKEKVPVAKKTDKERIVGTWRFIKGRAEGEDLPAEFTTLARMTLAKDGKFTISIAVLDDAKKGSYQIVEGGKIDLSGMAVGDRAPGIYKFEGDDRLTLCANQGGADSKRPTEFSGEKMSGQILFVLQRAKPGEEKPTPAEIAKFKGGADKIKEAAARSVSQNNLKQIGLAMHNYHDQHQSLPAHAIYSKDGKTALLSWRVAILPYIEQDALYKEFKLDEPWDSAHNKKLIAQMPKLYEAVIGDKKKGMTYYQVFTGPDTLFDGPKKLKFQDIAAGTANTLLVIEAKDPVVWTRPADLTLPKDKDKMPAVGGFFSNGFNVLMCDGSVRLMPLDTKAAVLRESVSPKERK